MKSNSIYKAGLYMRLSKDDERRGESTSIGTQRAILRDFCKFNQYTVHKEYIDDGYSGLNFERPGFREMVKDIQEGTINMIVTKDLSRLGRDYIMTGYYSEIYFPSQNVRFIAVSDNVDSLKGNNQIAPFKNILNDMYAQDISQKVKNAKQQRAKQGFYIGSQPPYGYLIDSDSNSLTVDSMVADVVKLIFSLAECGLGNVAIAKELKIREILTPSMHKYQMGDTRFARYSAIANSKPYDWCPATIGKILNDRVYLGELISLKSEVINHKTKKRITVSDQKRVVIHNAHEPLISIDQFENIKEIRRYHFCPANTSRDNLFRNKLFCECCGHPLTLTKKQLKNQSADIYFCMHHYRHPENCPQTHMIYHDVLYPYILQEIRTFAKTMKKRKVNSPLKNYTSLEAITPNVLNSTIERIEIGHITRTSKLGNVVRIYWKV